MPCAAVECRSRYAACIQAQRMDAGSLAWRQQSVRRTQARHASIAKPTYLATAPQRPRCLHIRVGTRPPGRCNPPRFESHTAKTPLDFARRALRVLLDLGAEGGTRTHTLLRAADFESAASTDSATSAWPRSIATCERNEQWCDAPEGFSCKRGLQRRSPAGSIYWLT